MAAKKSAKKDAAPVAITIPPVLTKQFKVQIQGMAGSSLVMHRWDRKQRDEILMKQMGIPMGKKAPKDPIRDFIGSMYFMNEPPEVQPIVVPEHFTSMDDLLVMPAYLEKALAESSFGVPAAAFRKGMISAARYVEGLTMVFIRGAFFIVGDAANGEMVTLDLDTPPIMREDAVTIGMNGTDFRYRGEFQGWSAELTVAYDPTLIKPAQLVNLLNRAGFSVGLLEGRPEKGGQWGRYEVLKSSAANKVAA